MAEIDRMSGPIIAAKPAVASPMAASSALTPAVAPEGEKGFFGKMRNTVTGMLGLSGGSRRRRGGKKSRKASRRNSRRVAKKSMRRRR